MKVLRLLQSLMICAAVLFAVPAVAQNFPNKTITIVVPFPPGGSSDILARSIASELTKILGVQVIVDNRPGASGMIGTGAVAKAAPDGYTLVLSTPGPITINRHLFSKLAYDPEKDFVPVTQIGTVPQILVVHPSVKANTVQELIALAKAQPEKLHYGSVGNGSTLHLAGAMFDALAGTKMVHVPYKGSAPALTDLLGGQIQVMFDVIVSALPQAKDGKLRAIAVTGSKRSQSAPELPTIAEAGLPGYNVVTWYGIMAPAGTPAPVVDVLNKSIVKALNTPALQQRLTELGADLVGSTPQEFADYLKKESLAIGDVVKKANIPLQ